jgi:hypothetical protein
MADAGYQSRKLARELKRRHGWQLRITRRRQRAFNGSSLPKSRQVTHYEINTLFLCPDCSH